MADDRTAPTTRRALALLAALVLVFAEAGCGGGDDDDGGDGGGAETTQPAPETADGGETAATDPAQGDPQAGEQIFADNCSTCHGPDGGGGSAPSLQDPELADDPDRVVDQIVDGGGGMPPFGDQLSEQEISDVAAFIVEDVSQR